MVPLTLLLALLLLGRFDDAPQRSGGSVEAAHRFARPTRGDHGLVLLSLSALVLEGAGVDWSAIYMRDVFGAAPFFGALAVTSRRAGAGATRYVADRFVERHSPRWWRARCSVVLGLGNAAGQHGAGGTTGAGRALR